MLGRLWQRSNWVNDLILPLLGALTWAVWGGVIFGALLNFVSEYKSNLNAGPAVLLLLLGGALAGRLAARQSRGLWVIVLGGLVAVLLAEWWLLFWPAYALWDPAWAASLLQQVSRVAPAPFLAAIVAAFVWRHGALADWSSHAEMSTAFSFGVLALGGALLLAAAFNPPAVNDLTGPAIQLLLAAWAALSLAGVSDASRTAAGSQPLRLNRYWVVAALTVVGGLFGLALLLTTFVTPQTVLAWLALLQPVVNVIWGAFVVVFVVATYLIFLVLTPLINWLRSLVGQPPLAPPQPNSPLTNPPTVQAASTLVLPPWAELLLRGLVIVGFVVLIALIIVWALRRQTATDLAGVRENRDLIWSWDLVKDQLAALLARRGPPPPFAELAGAADDPLNRVRRAYQRLLALALARGQARPPRQTPQAFLPTVSALWPGDARKLAELTDAYTAARYGQVPPSPEQLAAIQQALDRLDAAASKS